ncbi:MAG: glutaredoxin family protein [Pseudomonadota bacterium]|nr:glutaredoxin family protein [Pseudomonadota bacterium]
MIQYTRAGCGLCHDMDDALDAAFGDAIALEHRDVDARDDWRAWYGQDVPVLLTPGGEELCRHRLDEARVRAWLAGDDRPVAART